MLCASCLAPLFSPVSSLHSSFHCFIYLNIFYFFCDSILSVLHFHHFFLNIFLYYLTVCAITLPGGTSSSCFLCVWLLWFLCRRCVFLSPFAFVLCLFF